MHLRSFVLTLSLYVVLAYLGHHQVLPSLGQSYPL